MLYKEENGVFTPWRGGRINDVLYPLMIENLWSNEDLENLGLYLPAPADEVPEGKIVTGQSVERINGVVKYVYTLSDYVPEIPTRVSRRQAKLALLNAGLLDTVEIAIESLGASEKIEWVDALEFNRNDGLLKSIGASLGLTEEQIDNLFIQASNL